MAAALMYSVPYDDRLVTNVRSSIKDESYTLNGGTIRDSEFVRHASETTR